MRDNQKEQLIECYKGFAQRARLTPEQTDKLNDLLADNARESLSLFTTVLRDKPAPEQMNQIFAAQDAVLQEKLQALLGPDVLAQYEDYTMNLRDAPAANQFERMLTRADAKKQEKSKRFSRAMQEEVQGALASAGLPADYQLWPLNSPLNYRAIASEQECEQSLKLLDDIYQCVAVHASSFLSAKDIAKFQEFKTTDINNQRMGLTTHRTMMAPISN